MAVGDGVPGSLDTGANGRITVGETGELPSRLHEELDGRIDGRRRGSRYMDGVEQENRKKELWRSGAERTSLGTGRWTLDLGP